MEVSDTTKEIILGSILGDGCLTSPKMERNVRFVFRHSIIQKEYFLWKVKMLKRISSKKCFYIQPPDGWSKNEKLYYQSLSSPKLTELYSTTFRAGKFFVSERWLKFLTPLSLLIWWLDDGSLVKNSRQGLFCTEGFDKENILRLSRYLKNRWGIKTKVGRRGKYCQLRIYSTEELKKFFRLVLPYLKIKSMLPKFIILYNDSTLQQCWISEIVKLTGFKRSVVEKYLAIKRSKYKKFQKKI